MPLFTGPVSIRKARELPGLRLLVIPGVPSPWGEAAKAILRVKGIPHVRVNRMPSDPAFLRGGAASPDPEVHTILARRLLAHRDRIYREHLELPVVL